MSDQDPSRKAAIESLVNRGELSEGQARVASMKVDNQPALDTDFDQARQSLREAMEAVDPGALGTLISRLEEEAQHAHSEGDTKLGDDRSDMADALEKMRGGLSMKGDEWLERLAKRQVWTLVDLQDKLHLVGDPSIKDAFFQMGRTVEKMAEAKFPDELNKQTKARNDGNAAQIAAKREELGKIDVS
jgi:hypothetical protein